MIRMVCGHFFDGKYLGVVNKNNGLVNVSPPILIVRQSHASLSRMLGG